jgi:hypothetical protein
MNCTSIEITQYELLAQIIEHNAQHGHEPTNSAMHSHEQASALNDLIPIFLSKSNLCNSLERLALVYRDEPEANLCCLYLAVLQGTKNENI